jgi:transcriptional regulator with XRE-family HTH domain
MTDADDNALGAYLKDRRGKLDPAAFGFTPGRRRTPGLRREEMAQIGGMSPTWYAWIEQGRDISVSPGALARLATAMRLTPAERAYLFALARKRDPAERSPAGREDEPAAALRAALKAIAAPAYLLDRLWRARAWNEAAARLFAGWLGSGEAGLLEYVFLERSARAFIVDWENRARRLVAEFRADTGRDPEDPALAAVVDRLRAASVDFAAFWRDHAVLAREGGARAFNHPIDGALVYEQVTLTPVGRPDQKLVILVGPQTAG